MTQAQKKHTAGSQATKMASNLANKAAKSTYAAVDATRSSAENVIKIGSGAMKDFLASGAEEAQKAQEKVMEIGRESAQHLAKSADAVSKALSEAVAISRDNVETAIECAQMNAAMVKDVTSEVVEYTNRAFSDHVELSKEFFACRTLNDIAELNNKIVKNTFDNLFSQSAKLSNMLFEYSAEALEPINERVSQATEQFSKVIAA